MTTNAADERVAREFSPSEVQSSVSEDRRAALAAERERVRRLMVSKVREMLTGPHWTLQNIITDLELLDLEDKS